MRKVNGEILFREERGKGLGYLTFQRVCPPQVSRYLDFTLINFSGARTIFPLTRTAPPGNRYCSFCFNRFHNSLSLFSCLCFQFFVLGDDAKRRRNGRVRTILHARCRNRPLTEADFERRTPYKVGRVRYCMPDVALCYQQCCSLDRMRLL